MSNNVQMAYGLALVIIEGMKLLKLMGTVDKKHRFTNFGKRNSNHHMKCYSIRLCNAFKIH